ncbi:MAG: hypothetical protein IT347_06250 [Candidatus Eisenbacteria bacterium]|nr:hypothetical protein [Candidatus Eisenbacteria bacterium]
MTALPRKLLAIAACLVLAGCSSSPAPGPLTAPPPLPPRVVSGAPDTAGVSVGSPNALYRFRFKQTEPGGDFNFRDRDLTFYFRPTPTALYFRIENLQGRPVWINWDNSRFLDVNGRTGKVAHSTTRWSDRYSLQAQTQVPGQQQYSDYVFPMDDLTDPGSTGGEDQQPHRPLIPEDQSAPMYTGRSFGVDLEFLVEDRPRTYTFRFQVASVIPR